MIAETKSTLSNMNFQPYSNAAEREAKAPKTASTTAATKKNNTNFLIQNFK